MFHHAPHFAQLNHRLPNTLHCQLCDPNRRASFIADWLAHCGTARHLVNDTPARHAELVAVGAVMPFCVPEPPRYQPKLRCLTCSLSREGEPRLKYLTVDPATAAQHVASPDHQRRVTDGRQAIYTAAHINHPGRFLGEAW
jgi:hypothetical protein